MHKIDGPGHLDNEFVSEDAAIGRPPTLVTPEWLNSVQGELVSLVQAAGIALDKDNQTQVLAALAAFQSRQMFAAYTVSGTAPAFELTVSHPITTYTAALRYRVHFSAAGSGADTLSINGLAPKALKQYDSSGAKVAAVIFAGQLVDVEYDGVDFVLLWSLPASAGQPGQVALFAQDTAPDGFLKANGASISRSAYAALFSRIGTRFGAGNGSTTFNLPDFRGEFFRGWDDSRGVDLGRLLGSWQGDDLKAHAHVYSAPSASAAVIPGGSPNYSAISINAAATGTSGGSETRPRNLALLACIKY